ncbi:MAG TPA: DUF6178 family protein [Candidatus Polarisedimenticolaceae bacterium]|nr:DUF6178 family protein [Candidatus Polarisedimenticolaceae bacterium]
MPKGSLSIREQADLILRVPAAERVKLLLEAPRPMALVRALPDGDFYLTVREVGPHDSLPILALASAPQITHLLDLESWRGDRFDPLRAGAWVALLAETDEATLRRFVRNTDDEVLALLIRDWARIRPLEIDHEEPTKGHGITETGDERGTISPDGNHLLSPERTEHALPVRRFMEMLYHDDEARYRGLIRAALYELPSEVEEGSLKWRTARLEEHGYPPFEDALTAYAAPEKNPPLAPDPPEPDTPDGLTSPRAALRILGPKDLIVAAAMQIPHSERERVLFGLGALANRILIADREDPGSPESHRRVIERVGSYVGLALDNRKATDPTSAANTLVDIPTLELFREGYAKAQALAERARRLAAKVIDLVDAPLKQRIAALTGPRPLYIETKEDGETRARDFRKTAEIEETALTLDLIAALTTLLIDHRNTTPKALLAEERHPFEDVPRFSTLLLTALAWHATRGEIRIDRLPADVVADFLRTTASRRTAPADAPARAMEKLTDALAREGNLDRRTAAALAAFGVSCLDRLAADCGSLEPGTPVTPRVVGCLRLA